MSPLLHIDIGALAPVEQFVELPQGGSIPLRLQFKDTAAAEARLLEDGATINVLFYTPGGVQIDDIVVSGALQINEAKKTYTAEINTAGEIGGALEYSTILAEVYWFEPSESALKTARFPVVFRDYANAPGGPALLQFGTTPITAGAIAATVSAAYPLEGNVQASLEARQAENDSNSNDLAAHLVGANPHGITPSMIQAATVADLLAHLEAVNPHGITPGAIGAATTGALVSLQNLVTGIQTAQAVGLVGFQSKALMDADLDHAADTIALVTNDPVADNNWTYIKQGASGAGDWLKSVNDFAGRLAALEDGDTGYTGYHWVLADSSNNIVASINQAGELEANFTPGGIPNSSLALVKDPAGYSGFEFVVVDSEDNIISGTYADGSTIGDPVVIIPNVVVPSILGVGDSLSNGTWEPSLAALTGGVVNEFGWPGEKSHEIADRFLARDKSSDPDIFIFGLGRNDPTLENKGRVAYHLERMISDLTPDQDYLVWANIPIPGEAVGSAEFDALADARDSLAGIYKERFVDLHRGLVNTYDYGGFELAASFVQPAIGVTVTITLNKTANILSYASGWGTDTPPDDTREVPAEFYLGDLGDTDDLYLVESVDSATTITARRVSGSTPTGTTVENETHVSGYDLRKRFVHDFDTSAFNSDLPARSLKSDNIHYGDRGHALWAEIFYRRLNQLKML